MKRYLTAILQTSLLVGLLLPFVSRAQAPAWQMAMLLGNNGSYSHITGAATDDAGNVYVTGWFSADKFSIGSITLLNSKQVGNGYYFTRDTFVAKWSPVSKSFVWAQRVGGLGDELASAIAVSGGIVYVSGNSDSATSSFGDLTLTNTYKSGFVTKLTDAGAFVWARRIGGSRNGASYATALAVNDSNVYVAGNFSNPVLDLGEIHLASTSGGNMFVTKLTDAGNFVWAQQAGGINASEYGPIMAISGNNVYVAGDFSTLDFGLVHLTSAGSSDVFVTKITDTGSTGELTWVQRAGGSEGESVHGIAVSGSNVYITGQFASASADFGSSRLISPTPDAPHPIPHLFVARLTDAGSTSSFAWSIGTSSGGGDTKALACVAKGPNLYVVGSATDAITIGDTHLPAQSANNYSGLNIAATFVAKLADEATTGSFRWALSITGPVYNVPSSVLALRGSTIYVAGSLGSPVSFGSIKISSGDGAFLASFTDATLTPTIPAQSSSGFTLAPNPAQARTTVQLPAVPGAITATLTLLDALGRPVRTRTVALPAAGLRYELDLTGLPAGLYALRVAAGTQSTTRRLVVE